MKNTLLLASLIVSIAACGKNNVSTESEVAAQRSAKSTVELEILKKSIGLKTGTLKSIEKDFEIQTNSPALGTECSLNISDNGESVTLKFVDIQGKNRMAEFSHKKFDAVKEQNIKLMTATTNLDLLKELNLQFKLNTDDRISEMKVYTVTPVARIDYSCSIDFQK